MSSGSIWDGLTTGEAQPDPALGSWVYVCDVREALCDPPQEWVDDHEEHIAVHAFLAAPGIAGHHCWLQLSGGERDRWRGVVRQVMRMVAREGDADV